MEKAARIKQLIEARTALIEVVSGLCDNDFEAAFGEPCLSIKKRLAHIAVVDWDVAKTVREVSQGKGQFLTADWNEGKAGLVEPRCCAPANEVLSEVVLSLQALLDELRPLSDEHFRPSVPDEACPRPSVASLMDVALRCTQHHYEEICSWRNG